MVTLNLLSCVYDTRALPLLIQGPSGCGKTTQLNKLLEETNAEVCRITTDDLAAEGAKGILRRLETFRDTRTVDSFFMTRRKVALIDDIDAMYAMDRLVQSTVLGFIRDPAFATSGILLLMTATDERKLTEMKKRVDVIRMTHPTPDEAVVIIANNLAEAHPKLAINKDTLLTICQANNGAIQASTIQFLAQLSENGDVDSKREGALELSLRDCGMYDVLHRILAGSVAPRDSDTLTGYDPTVMALLYYDNVPKHVSLCGGVGTSGVLAAKRRLAWPLHHMHILECNNLFGSDMSLGDLAAMLRCKLMCAEADHRVKQPKTKPEKSDKQDRPDYVFTQILARTAQKYHVEKRTNALLQFMELSGGKEAFYDACADAIASGAADWTGIVGGDEEMGELLRQLATPYCEHVAGVARTKLNSRVLASRRTPLARRAGKAVGEPATTKSVKVSK
jgi:energy-coupling factor transporter ATP-binding protein EcfA2